MQLHLLSSVVEPSVSVGINRSAQSSSHPAFKSFLEVVLQKPSAEEDKHTGIPEAQHLLSRLSFLVPPLLFSSLLFYFTLFLFPLSFHLLFFEQVTLWVAKLTSFRGLKFAISVFFFFLQCRSLYLLIFCTDFQTVQVNVHLGLLRASNSFSTNHLFDSKQMT